MKKDSLDLTTLVRSVSAMLRDVKIVRTQTPALSASTVTRSWLMASASARKSSTCPTTTAYAVTVSQRTVRCVRPSRTRSVLSAMRDLR